MSKKITHGGTRQRAGRKPVTAPYIEEISTIYARTIPTIKKETKKETAARVSALLGRIEKNVFWRVVQIVRSR